VPAGDYYDYHAKYIAEDTQYLCPGLKGTAEDELRALALAAFRAADCAGWARVDVMRDTQGRNFLLEVNTTPGMTSHSLVPKAARALGIEFDELVWQILESSAERERADRAIRRRNRRTAPAAGSCPDRWRRLMTALAFFALAALAAYALILALDQPIHIVSIEAVFSGSRRCRSSGLSTAASNRIHVRRSRTRARTRGALAWVDQARVQRRWPQGLRIEVTEQVAAAR
jgi:hypothetical protein